MFLLLDFASPILIVKTLATLMQDSASIFFMQEHSGKKGKIYKFRSMAKNSAKISPAEAGDLKITCVGPITWADRIAPLEQTPNADPRLVGGDIYPMPVN